MSLLLDALRKADRERRSDQPPSPFEASAPVAALPASAAPRRVPSGLAAGLWGLVIALLVLALVIWQRAPAPDPTSVEAIIAPTPQPTPTAPPVPTPDVPERPPLPRRTPPPTPAETLLTLDELAMPPVAPINPVERPAATPVVEAPVRPLPEPDAEAVPAEPDLPEGTISRTDLPAAQRERIPAYRLDVHAYHSDPGRRFVLIEGQRHTEGSTLEGGFVLNEIVPQGIVIEAEGQRVLIRRPG